MIEDVSGDPEIAIVTSRSISCIREIGVAVGKGTTDLRVLQTQEEAGWGQSSLE